MARQNEKPEHHRFWTCELTATPARVYPDQPLSLRVTLSHPHLPEWSRQYGDDITATISRVVFSSKNARLDEILQKLTKNPAIIARMPALPDGDYEIFASVEFFENEIFAVSPESTAGGSATVYRLPETIKAHTVISVVPREVAANVRLMRSASRPTDDQSLWAAIRNRTDAVSFPRYQRFIDQVFGQTGNLLHGAQNVRTEIEHRSFPTLDHHKTILGTHAYSVLKLATQAFLTLECGVFINPRLFDADTEAVRFDDPGITAEALQERLSHYLVNPESHISALPYLQRIASAFLNLDRLGHADRQDGAVSLDHILRQRLTSPSMIELIWSYWQEEGMLVQTINAIARRFQNQRGGENDPLSELEFDHLRPLSNVFWGYIQDEQNRLTVSRRAHEYHHHYGLSLEGKAVTGIYPADSRSRFIEAFHGLLYRTELFYREDRDTTMIADAFPLLNALQEVHMMLAQGAGNQFGDLTWTARGEMLITQWMMARPEMREFLRGRYGVPYQEAWMGGVDAMKRLQGWGDTPVTHFHDLAVTGERILLSIRYGDWVDSNNIEEQAKNWARNLKPEVQKYMFSYGAVTGHQLTSVMADVSDTGTRFAQPSSLLMRRLAEQKPRGLPSPVGGLRLQPPATLDMPAKAMARLPRRGAGGDQ